VIKLEVAELVDAVDDVAARRPVLAEADRAAYPASAPTIARAATIVVMSAIFGLTFI
jgi:hypothetical protein